MSERRELYDSWAKGYDEGLKGAVGFPFEGYERVLEGVVGGARVGRGAHVLNVGTGTGALAARLAVPQCRVLGVDFSEEMLERARADVPTAEFRRLDLLGDWGDLSSRHFDAVVSAYVFHEFDLPTKTELLGRLAALLNPGGRLVLGDISFATASARDACYRQWRAVCDESEDYWVAEAALSVLHRAGFSVAYRQVSFCGGVYTLGLKPQLEPT